GPNLMVVGSFWMIGHWHWPPPLMQPFCSSVVEQDLPFCVPPTHVDLPRAGSAQSINPLPSLSTMSAHISGPVGMQGTIVVVVVVMIVVVVVEVVVVTQMMWFWSQLRLVSQPAVVQLLASVSGHGVLSGRFGNSHIPVCGLHAGGPVHGLVSSGQLVTMWSWSQLPLPSQPGVVQRLLSESGHGVLSGTFGKSQLPVCGLQTGGPVQGLVSSVQVLTMWFWSQLPIPSHPAVVQALLSASGQGVLSCLGVSTHIPVIWLQTESRHGVDVQAGQSGIELDCCPDDVRPLSHLASFCAAR